MAKLAKPRPKIISFHITDPQHATPWATAQDAHDAAMAHYNAMANADPVTWNDPTLVIDAYTLVQSGVYINKLTPPIDDPPGAETIEYVATDWFVVPGAVGVPERPAKKPTKSKRAKRS